MRVLFLTNFYPPYELGGQGLSCQQVVCGLRRRGHETFVLTSMRGTGNRPVEEEGVSRSLYLEMDDVPWRNSLSLLTQRKAREAHNLQRLEAVLQEVEPDLLFIWGMWNLPRSLAWRAEELYQERVVYRFAEYWPTLPSQYTLYWQAEGRTLPTRLLRRLLRPLALALGPDEQKRPVLHLRNMICVSEAVRQELIRRGIDATGARVIRTGLDMKPYVNGSLRPPGRAEAGPLRLLYAGRLAVDKGVHVLIEALEQLVRRDGDVRLDLVGGGDAEYEARLRSDVARRGLQEHVTFRGRVPREQMPAIYAQHDVLVLPSIWPEPFARVVLEGMASALVVVATDAGGSAEIICDGENGLLCRAGDAEELAGKLLALQHNPARRARLAAAARQTILSDYTEERLLDQMENYLQELLPGSVRE